MFHLLVAAYLLCTTAAIVLMKHGLSASSFTFEWRGVTASIHPHFALGICFYALSFALWVLVLNFRPISYVVPVTTGITQVLIVSSGMFLLQERLTSAQLVGIGLIIAGTILVTTKRL
jgi:multidrug transporter EmrE-like cation transporter